MKAPKGQQDYRLLSPLASSVVKNQERIINKSVQLPIASVDTALSGAKC